MNAKFNLNGRKILTERLILRPFEYSDLNDFYQYASVEGVGEMAGWKHHGSREESRKILDLFIREDKTFALCLKEDNKVIGSLGVEKYGKEDKLSEFFDCNGRELGFVLSKKFWGRGIMPEAVSAVIKFLFHECNMDFLLCGHFLNNGQSKKVQQKCGFVPYRKLVMQTQDGRSEEGILNLILNPQKNIKLSFSHPETLIYGK